MKGLFECVIVDILEESDLGYRIGTNYGPVLTDKTRVTKIPDEILEQYEPELQKIEEYMNQVRNKINEINQRYYAKKLELDGLITNAGAKKVLLIHEMQMKAMGMKGDAAR